MTAARRRKLTAITAAVVAVRALGAGTRLEIHVETDDMATARDLVTMALNRHQTRIVCSSDGPDSVDTYEWDVDGGLIALVWRRPAKVQPQPTLTMESAARILTDIDLARYRRAARLPGSIEARRRVRHHGGPCPHCRRDIAEHSDEQLDACAVLAEYGDHNPPTGA